MIKLKNKIAIDLDGVLRDFDGKLVNIVEKYYPQYLKKQPNYGPPYTQANPSGKPITKITDWYLANNFADDVTDDQIRQIYWYDYAEEIMANGKPFKNNVDTMKQLIEDGEHTYVCVTSQKEHIYHHSLMWLGKHKLNFNTVYFKKGRDKWKLNIDYLIDDSPANWSAWKRGRGTEEGFILKDRPYNQHIDVKYRIKNLSEMIDIVNEVEI